MTESNDPSRPTEPVGSDAETDSTETTAMESDAQPEPAPAPTAPAPEAPAAEAAAGSGSTLPSYPSHPESMAYGETAVAEGYFVDPQSGLTLPVGTELASAGRRIGGYFLDALLAIVTLGIGYLIWSLIIWRHGLTPAKQLIKMRCYRKDEHRHASWGYMALRQFVGGGIVEGFVPFAFIVSAIMMLASRERRAIHDHIAGTIVLYDPEGVTDPNRTSAA